MRQLDRACLHEAQTVLGNGAPLSHDLGLEVARAVGMILFCDYLGEAPLEHTYERLRQQRIEGFIATTALHPPASALPGTAEALLALARGTDSAKTNHLVAALVSLARAEGASSFAEALRQVADLLGREPESVRRMYYRSRAAR